ncbi:TatD family hydrolase [Candidatus Bealeia paramacronuclearis]|uniref:TatD family hydrolase n=1 Tax=Candidatus Bealeia paramacronuclearis TaxID=1921001 RepID=A0ABZ2C462_9PROT|nr:TatD family hydrolase [Candidatus Bealeia paramacronuclearis]
MTLVDSHCHLDYAPMIEDVSGTIARAEKMGVGGFLTICTELEKIPTLIKIAESAPNIWATVGTHPHESEPDLKHFENLKKILEETLLHPKMVGLGETGLDYYYEHSPKEPQKNCFAKHIEVAVQKDIPLIVHTRDAEHDTMDLLKSLGQGKVRGVMHCFSGSEWLLKEALDLGFYISYSGIITFKKAEELRRLVGITPLERMLVETDAPYLTPEPHRGKPNEPANVVFTAERVAAIKDVNLDLVASKTTANFFSLFTKAKS